MEEVEQENGSSSEDCVRVTWSHLWAEQQWLLFRYSFTCFAPFLFPNQASSKMRGFGVYTVESPSKANVVVYWVCVLQIFEDGQGKTRISHSVERLSAKSWVDV